MMSMTNLNVRIDEDVKRSAEAICQELGMTLSTAVNVFLRQTVRTGGIPFEVRITPTAETRQAMQDAKEHRSLSGPFHDAAEVMEALNHEGRDGSPD